MIDTTYGKPLVCIKCGETESNDVETYDYVAYLEWFGVEEDEIAMCSTCEQDVAQEIERNNYEDMIDTYLSERKYR